jgi:hypothetical protein
MKRKKHNPAKSASQYGAAEAVLGGMSNIMPRSVAAEIVKHTPAAMRSRFARELAARRRHSNPSESDLDAVARMYTQFHGRPPKEWRTVTQKRVTPDVLADLGRLIELRFRRPGYHDKLTFPESGPRSVRVATTGNGGQLYFVGGDQEIDLRGAGFELPKDHVCLGKCHTIVYFTSKDFHNFEPSEYIHHFGDEGGERPHGGYDIPSKRLYLIGGDYRVKREGIVG